MVHGDMEEEEEVTMMVVMERREVVVVEKTMVEGREKDVCTSVYTSVRMHVSTRILAQHRRFCG